MGESTESTESAESSESSESAERAGAAPGPIAVPAAARARLIAIVARSLDAMLPAQIPVRLRKGASFTQARRVKLLGPHLLEAVESDDEFRGHVAAQARAIEPAVAGSLDSGAGVADHDLATAAAVAYLIRGEGWRDVVEAAAQSAESAAGSDDASSAAAASVERMASALDAARADAKSARDRQRAQIDDLKAANAQLRRTLADARRELRDALDSARAADERAAIDAREAAHTTKSLESETRRLRARIAELEADSTSARRAARGDRDAEVMRLRLLLDTVVDAVAGLRRELALPPSDLLPADTVVALEPAADSSAVGAGKAMPDDDPALLRRLIDLPRVHLIVDGYNVTKAAWPELPLDRQRSRLVRGVNALVVGKGIETTVVFDGADLVNPPAVTAPRAVRVRFSPPGVIADDLIRQLVEAEPVGRPVVVVSTDREVARTVTKKGARAVASLALIRALGS
jgi:predicted RNA-binding protein with PIN domain